MRERETECWFYFWSICFVYFIIITVMLLLLLLIVPYIHYDGCEESSIEYTVYWCTVYILKLTTAFAVDTSADPLICSKSHMHAYIYI